MSVLANNIISKGLLVALVVSIIPAAVAFEFLPIQGDIELGLVAQEIVLTEDAGSFIAVHALAADQKIHGTGLVSLTGSDFPADITFTQHAQEVGTASLLQEDNSIILSNIFLNGSQDASQCLPNGNNLFCMFSFGIASNPNAELQVSIDVANASLEKSSYALISDFTKGALVTLNLLEVDLSIPVIDEITEFFSGEVLAANGKPLAAGSLVIATFQGEHHVQIVDGFFEKTAVHGKVGDIVSFIVDDQVVETVTLEEDQKATQLILAIPQSGSGGGFPDGDRDGVPDPADQCAASQTSKTNAQGCSGSQSCNGDFHDFGLGPVCLQTCFDNVQNQNEQGVDCGGPCMKQCPNVAVADNAIVEVSEPEIEDNESGVCEGGCQECGCPDMFTCQSDGQCKSTVSGRGMICLDDEYQFEFSSFDCNTLGEDWMEKDVMQYIDISVSGFPILKGIVKGKVEDKLQAATLCLKTVDLGCTNENTQCTTETRMEQRKPEIEEEARKEAQQRIDSAIPGILDIFVGVDVNVDLKNATVLEEEYSCDEITISPSEGCELLIDNGDSSSKTDIVFIGDGFAAKADLSGAIKNALDYPGTNMDTKAEGLFSREPFKSSKEQFNVWILHTNQELEYGKSSHRPDRGSFPLDKSVLSLAQRCPAYDNIIVFSQRNKYRPWCSFDTKICVIPLPGEDFLGRIVAHEFGHGFAGLADEYVRTIAKKDHDNVAEGLDLGQIGPNCKATMEEAKAAWGSIADAERTIGFFDGCEGDCSEDTCQGYIRPTVNSVMRNQDDNCDSVSVETCKPGPPFDPWYAVNEMEIEKKLR